MIAWYAFRSLLFYLGYLPLIVFFSTLGFTLGLLLPYRPRQTLITCANALIIAWLRVTCGVKWRVVGRQHLPTVPYVALSKHQSPWETFYLQRLLRPVSTILKRELLRVPFFGWGLATTRPIAIDRSNPREAMREVLAQGKQRLASGNNVLIYPEGTRIAVGEVGQYGRSGAALAVAAGVPLVPISHNAGLCWPARQFVKYPGTVEVIIGEPMTTIGVDSKKLAEDAKIWIESTLQSLPPHSLS